MTPTVRPARPPIFAAALAALALLLAPWLAPAGPARAQGDDVPAAGDEPSAGEESHERTTALSGHDGKSGKNYVLPPERTHRGDAYRLAQSADIAGVHDGDLFMLAQHLTVSGEVTGDTFALGQHVTLTGRHGDSVRIMGNTVMISGVIDGNVLAGGETITLTQDSHVTGDLLTFASQAFIRGRVDGDVRATVGELVIGGQIGRDVRATTSVLRFEDGARIEGDLKCTTQQDPPEVEGRGIVGGRVTFDKQEIEEEDEDEDGGWFWTIFLFLSSLIVGWFFLALFRQPARSVAESIGFANSAIGFLAWMVIPFAAAISCLLVVTIPLAALVFLLWLILTYLAKLPVAYCLGSWILKRLGRPDPSPFLALPLGLVVLYIVFMLPFLIGSLAWFLTLFAGFGAIIVGLKTYLGHHWPQAPGAPPVTSPAMPPISPATS